MMSIYLLRHAINISAGVFTAFLKFHLGSSSTFIHNPLGALSMTNGMLTLARSMALPTVFLSPIVEHVKKNVSSNFRCRRAKKAATMQYNRKVKKSVHFLRWNGDF